MRGTVVILHGRTEFIEKYFETVNDLRRRGFAVATFDARGQGGSGRLLGNQRKGHVRDFADHVNDFETVMQEVVLPDCPPPYLRARAFDRRGGGAPFGRAAPNADRPHGADCAAPRADLRGSPKTAGADHAASSCISGWARPLRQAAGATLMQTQPFAGNPLTSDPVRYQRTSRDRRRRIPSIGVGGATIGWVNAGDARLPPLGGAGIRRQRVPMPVLIVLAGADSIVQQSRRGGVCAPREDRRAISASRSSHHEILMERISSATSSGSPSTPSSRAAASCWPAKRVRQS